ncbi:MAG: endolytic transglycosylase MltG [Microgenomates group bacterium]
MKTLFKITILLLALTFFVFSIYVSFFGPVSKNQTIVTFVVPQNRQSFNLSESLIKQNLIKNKKAFDLLHNYFFKNIEIKEGGYYIDQSLNSWQILNKITSKQDLLWVNIYYCPRKEQVGEKLANTLDWSEDKLKQWNNLFKNTDYYEGVFYPDTYLIPVNESVEQVAQRFTQNFEEKFAPLSSNYLSKNIKWTTGLKIASLIAREAAGREDAKLISGIIWNRLNQDMRLQIDATMQYTLGKNENGSWWGAIDLEQKRLDSPYNSYKNEGLPPTPICSPNVEYIEAALNPEETDCIFYLHDSNRQIHCAKTYEEHKENIKSYL